MGTFLVVVLCVFIRSASQSLGTTIASKLASSGGAGGSEGGGRGGAPTFGEAMLLISLHKAYDQMIAVVAVPIWGRAIFKYLATVRLMRAPALAVRVLSDADLC